jgi:hypothetical protein
VECRGWCSAHYTRWKRHGDPLGGRVPEGEPMRYFQEVVLPYKGDDCLKWPYGRTRAGYGQVGLNGRQPYVHALACEYIHGSAPTPKHVASHKCGKGHEGCCNPRHTAWQTRAEDAADRLVHGTHNRGRRHYIYKRRIARALCFG